MHVRSELKSQQGYPKLLLVLKMQANKHFDHLSVSFFEWPKISVGCNPPFLLCLISSTFLHSGYFLSWLVISFPMPNLVPQLLLPWLLDFFCAAPTWLFAFSISHASTLPGSALVPAVQLPCPQQLDFQQQLLSPTPPAPDRRAAAETEPQSCWERTIYHFMLSHSPRTLRITQWKLGKLRTVLWAAMNHVWVRRHLML